MVTPQRFVVLLGACVVVLVGAAMSLSATGYRYFGARRTEVPRHYVSLDSATLTNGHVAVWVGASQGQEDWVQGGVADEGAGPFAYIELKRRQPPRYSLLEWPTTFGHRVRVRLFQDSYRRWRVEVAGHISRSVLLRFPNSMSILETLGDSSGTGTIDHHTVSSTP